MAEGFPALRRPHLGPREVQGPVAEACSGGLEKKKTVPDFEGVIAMDTGLVSYLKPEKSLKTETR